MKRILIIRPSAIGDIIMASPMIPAIRRAWPDAYVAWLADPAASDLLRHNRSLDGIVYWSKTTYKGYIKKGRWIKLIKEVIDLRRKLRRLNFDLAIDAQGLLRSRLLAWLSDAPERIGFDSKEPGRCLMTRIISRGHKKENMSSEYYHLVKMLGLSPIRFKPDIHLDKADMVAAENKLIDAGVNGAYAVICPFTTRPQKHWFIDRWAELTDELATRNHLPVVALGGPNDAAASRRIEALAQNRLYNLTAQTSLGQAAAVINNAALVVGVDTGLTHLGTAFERPTVALFGATRPYLHTPSPRTIVLYREMPCAPCRRRPVCAEAYTCMLDIGVADVVEAVATLLGQP
jgi:heptosyltransferase-1